MWFAASVHQELGEPAGFANLFCKLLDFMIIVLKCVGARLIMMESWARGIESGLTRL
jgi:hypothetical protein